ncbi:type I-E CRISPR-associated protein Cas5/CasD [Nitrosospira lacus]|uniref:Type I-E CRISPR-associated protein Cas5/CasD n=1 Tax=Nitrosospira lacus TaxID=1288494 RepID=A0A1W6SPM6_9PROT|nr:type I-E CRISPR-associated protein Cas5/CasD [Nitrosospira lacus]ARO87749.1 type I-E CRISPR-associated protein Cas5/CasD [Nitrosospira lacus]
MHRHLLLRLESPLSAFGGETIDNFGVTRDFPALSMVTGLFANALGWRREDCVLHDRLQSRLIVGTRLNTPLQRLRDFQTAQLGKNDKGWTTWGIPEERRGGAGTYEGPHLRYRDYHASLDVLVALRLEPAHEAPTLSDLALALDHPARPLFIGRKSCLPSHRLFSGWQEADNVLHALRTAQIPEIGNAQSLRMQWPDGEGRLAGDRLIDLCDERNWTSGVHGGWRPVREGSFTLQGAQT